MKTIWIAQRVINGNWEGQSYYCFSSYKKTNRVAGKSSIRSSSYEYRKKNTKIMGGLCAQLLQLNNKIQYYLGDVSGVS
jgi:hypothetical protein